MADFRLGRLKFNWRGAWVPSEAYVIDDIVSFKGNTYVCVVNHTSASDETLWANTDYNIATPRWQLHVPGIRIMGNWTGNTFFAVNDLVAYGANQYLCQTDHTSTANEEDFYTNDLSNWSLYTAGTTYKGDWSAGTWYKLNDIVKYGNTLYLTTLAHTSGIQFDESKYSVYLESVNFEDTWDASAEYQPGDIITYGGYSYVAKTINTGKQPNIYNVDITGVGGIVTPADWDILTTGFDVKGEYDNATVYIPGDVVQFGGDTYVKISTGSAGVYPIDQTAWEKVASGLNWRGPWNSTSTYQVNDVVSKQSASWVNLTAHSINIDPVADQTLSTEVSTFTFAGGTTVAGEASATYTAVAQTSTSGSGANATFTITRDGNGDIDTVVVVDRGTGYAYNDTITIAAADITDTADLIITVTAIGTGTGGTNWQALAQGESTLTLQNPGDILYRNASGANVNLPIGTEGQILTVSDQGVPAWERNNTCANVYYVATDGTDDPDYGKNISKPWRTIRYALAQTAGLGTVTDTVSIFVKSGTYEEQLPLVTSPHTSIIGDNLRATVIKPDPNTQSDPTSASITGWSGSYSDENAKENRYSTMFYLTEGVILKDLVMVGMEGFEEDTTPDMGWDIEGSNWEQSGVFLRLRADVGILTKSPYVSQCSAFSGRTAAEVSAGTTRYGGGIGAIVDRSIYDVTGVGLANSNGSMLFDSFTQFHDGGVGFWCKDLGNAEVVSCFTYYCHIGYACTGGGRIRSLSGNNSYGHYGAISKGTDATETALTASVRGQRLNHAYDENSTKFNKGEFVVQGTANTTVEDFTTGSSTTVGGAATFSPVAQSATSGTGAGATFSVERDGSGAIINITVISKGAGYAANDTITIDGADIGGVTTTDDVILTVTTLGDDFTVTNANYALALILYKADAGEVDGETTGEDFLLIESVTGSFSNNRPIAACDENSVLITSPNPGATAVTKASDALSGIYGSVFTLTDLPVTGSPASAVIPRKTASVEFLDVVGSPAYDDDDYYTINSVTDDTTAELFSLSTTRRYDVPGANADALQIQQISRASDGTVTLTTNAAHGLVAGDEVNIVISNSQFVYQFPSQPSGSQGQQISLQSFSTPAFQRTTVLQDGLGLYTFKYNDPNNSTLDTETYTDAQYLGTGSDVSRVYKVSTSGGGTNSVHTGGSELVLYSAYNQAILLDSGGATELSNSQAFLTVQSSAWTNNITTTSLSAGTAFLLINNEIMQVDPTNNSQLQAGGGSGSATINVVRGQEGTSAQVHSDGSVIYLLTKIPQQTTLKRNVADINSGGSTTEIDLPVFDNTGILQHDIIKIDNEFFRVDSVNTTNVGQATITFAIPKEQSLYNGANYGAFEGQALEIRLRYSQVRLTGHDFLLIGTGSKADTNWPNQPNQLPNQENEVFEGLPGRVYYTSTDHDGNFRVGNLFQVEQATGSATLNASAFSLSGLTSLRLGTIGAQLGAEINEFSTDVNLGGEFSRDSACPTQLAVKTYVDNNVGSGILRTAPTHTAQTLVSTGVTATFTSFGNHSFNDGDIAVITGASPSTYNGRFEIFNVTNNTFQYTLPSSVVGGQASGLAIVAERIQKIATELNIAGEVDITSTWNEVGEDKNALVIDITDTASGSGSKLIDAQVGGASKFSVSKEGNIVAAGSLNVQGTLTTVNSVNLTVADLNVIVANGATDEITADGAGLTVGSSGLGFTYQQSDDTWQLPNAGLNVGGTIQINGTDALSSTTLGTNVVNSSLTSLGTLTGLSVAGNSAIQAVSEKINVVSSGSGDETFDFSTGAIYFYNSVSADLNALFTNVPEDAGKAHSFVIAITQASSGTPRKFSNSVGVNGTAITCKWLTATQPEGELSRVETWVFTIINTSSTSTPSWTVLGQQSSFG